MEIGERGFVFSLDAVFAILLTALVVAGTVKLELPGLGYEQHGYQRLSRSASDALLCLEKSGILAQVATLLMNGENENAARLAREALRSLLSEELQFRLDVAENGFYITRTQWRRVGWRWVPYTVQVNCHLTVYPDNLRAWDNAFSSQGEMAVAYRVTTDFLILENFRVLAWVDDNKENAFVHEVCQGWLLPWTTNNEAEFRNLLASGPDVVFLPDVSVQWSSTTVWALYAGNSQGSFGVVGGGETVAGQSIFNRITLGRIFGVSYRRTETNYENVRITDNTHYITSDFSVGDDVPYERTLNQYRYRLSRWAASRVLAQSYWSGGRRQENAAIIARAESARWWWRQQGRAVLFNTRLAQSAMYDNLEVRHQEWVILARKAIEWASKKVPRLQPVRLYVWRGGEPD
ncbi:MAG: hypothetical protein QXH26_04240 [Candidatus Hadarchaeales archaeon]